MHRTFTAIALAIGLCAMLTSCSIGFTPFGGSGSTPDPRPAIPTDPVPTATPPDAATASVRDQYIAGATTVSCPDGVLEISSVAVVVKLDGPCDNLIVTGTSAIVIAQQVGDLTVSAVSAVVSVESADTIMVTKDSTSSFIEWVTGSPVIADDGLTSVIRQVS